MATLKWSNRTKRPPENWIRFENAYIIVILPSLIALVNALPYFNLHETLKDTISALTVFSGSLVKGLGVFLGTDAKPPSDGRQNESSN